MGAGIVSHALFVAVTVVFVADAGVTKVATVAGTLIYLRCFRSQLWSELKEVTSTGSSIATRGQRNNFSLLLTMKNVWCVMSDDVMMSDEKRKEARSKKEVCCLLLPSVFQA
jgi:hypothetical protein